VVTRGETTEPGAGEGPGSVTHAVSVPIRRPRLTAQDRIDRAYTEAAFQSKVCALATAHGWRWWHAPANRPNASGHVQDVRAGWPDLTLVRRDRLVFAELKRQVNAPVTEAQEEWLAALRATGAEVYVLRPSDLGLVRQILGAA